MKPPLTLIVLMVISTLPAIASAEDADLYRARTIVTGHGPDSQATAARNSLRDVLVKVSGDPGLLTDPRVAPFERDAATLVAASKDVDRMAGIQIHDEQGSRERSFALTVSFEPHEIDDVLAKLGRKPWPEPRPKLLVLIGVENGDLSYVLAKDGAHGRDQREALEDAAWQMGLRIALPSQSQLDGSDLSFDSAMTPQDRQVEQLARASHADLALTGRLDWNATALGWVADWQLADKGRSHHHWQIREVSFDDAFRSAMRGAAQILSGHGAPP
jgi:uncharacterized protein